MKKSRVLFWIYCAVMLWLLFGQRLGGWPPENYREQILQQLNLVPFDTLRRFFWVIFHSHQQGLMTHAFINLAGNVVMFLPLGLFLPVMWPKLARFFRFLAVCFLLILTVELVQLATLLGSFDVDDLILNLLGAALGFWLLKLWQMRREKRKADSK